MKIITRHDVIKSTINEWRGNSDIYPKLIAIGDNITEQQIEDIIGRQVIHNICNECDLESEIIVVIGEEEDIDSATAHVCKKCLERALKMMA